MLARMCLDIMTFFAIRLWFNSHFVVLNPGLAMLARRIQIWKTEKSDFVFFLYNNEKFKDSSTLMGAILRVSISSRISSS